ncbi:MAG: DUF1837 domain-containing protein [Magnetococcus sp. YQC-5]
MNFEILIDDLYLKIFTDTYVSLAKNKSVLSLVNDFEDHIWRYEKFENFVWDNIAMTALSAQEREKLIGKSHSSLKASAKKLRLTDKEGDVGGGSELAEIVLYGIMHNHYKALSVVPKIFYKQNTQDYAKGADSVHIVLEGLDDFSLWFGEAKFYNSIDDTRLFDVVESVKKSLDTDKLKKENSIVTSLADIDLLVGNKGLSAKIKSALSDNNSMDLIKPRIHVPILLLHQCGITASAKEIDETYRENIKKHHKERAKAYFNKQICSLSRLVTKYSDVKFHIILFPVPDKEKLIEKFSNDVKFYKG